MSFTDSKTWKCDKDISVSDGRGRERRSKLSEMNRGILIQELITRGGKIKRTRE
jgi:hypothetical protein